MGRNVGINIIKANRLPERRKRGESVQRSAMEFKAEEQGHTRWFSVLPWASDISEEQHSEAPGQSAPE
jgi:hypothetical protein